MASEIARQLPSVDEIVRSASNAVDQFGRPAVTDAVRSALAEARSAGATSGDVAHFAALAFEQLAAKARPSLRPVFNLTGTVLHTNLGRALLAEEAVEAAVAAMRSAVALEFDVGGGHRGERDDHVRQLLCDLTGAEDATVVNNNAAAVLLVLNTFASGREAIVSRGELIEIGGAFRMPEIMSRAGAKLVEIGTTNRTHAKDYVGAIGASSGIILKVHTSNYRIEGFTKEVSARELAAIAAEHKVPLVNDLGSGTLVDLRRFGLGHEPTVAEAVAEGADLVTFSGDKLLGGPQAGFIVGRKELIAKLNRNPMKRSLRIDKIRLAALEATLKLYRDPDRLAARLPTLRLLSRSPAEIEAQAERILPAIEAAIGDAFTATVGASASQIGSGALPVETIASAGIVIRSTKAKGDVSALSNAFRRLPRPVVGRIEDRALVFDLRCLEDEDAFVANLAGLKGQPMTWLDRFKRTKTETAEIAVKEQMAAAYDAASRGEHKAALDIWGPLAHAGVARAQNNIGACFAEGLGVERDPALALRWLTLAAENKDPVGQRNLAALYFKGDDVEQDYARAAELYRAASEAGDGPAQDMLSWMLMEGEVMPPDPAEARHWAQAAAAQGIASAMTRMGMIFHNAIGVERDPRTAAEWWAKAAEAGDADGQAMLGAAFHLGTGVPRDAVAAYALLLRARSNGSPLAAPFIDAVRSTLSPVELQEAEFRAAAPLAGAAA